MNEIEIEKTSTDCERHKKMKTDDLEQLINFLILVAVVLAATAIGIELYRYFNNL